MATLDVLQTYLRWNALLILWADMPWPPIAELPAPRAAAIGRMRGEARALAAIDWPLPGLPPAPILSLDPSNRLAQAWAAAGKPLHTLRTLADVPAPARHNLLQLGGDLDARQGLLLTWADVRRLRSDADKRHLLAEAARTAAHGGVLLLRPTPDAAFARVWRQIGPALGETQLFGLGPGHWPEDIVVVEEAPAEVFGALSAVEPRGKIGVRHSAEIDSLRKQRAQRSRRLWKLREQSARRSGDVDVLLAIEDEEQAIGEIERRLDALQNGGAG